MRTLAAIVLILLVALIASPIEAQDEVSQPRGDSGRSGEFYVSPLGGFERILWKSPKFLEVSVDSRGLYDARVLGERLRYSASPFGSRSAADAEIRLWNESMPLHHKGSLFISINLGGVDPRWPLSFTSEPADGFLITVDAKTGQPNWVYRCGDCYISNPVAFEDWIILVTRDRRNQRKRSGSITAVDRSTGKKAWSIPAGTSLATPTIHGDVLYFIDGPLERSGYRGQTSESAVNALNLRTRKPVWSFAAKGAFDSPVVSNGLVLVGSNRDFLYAVDTTTGLEKWRFKAEARGPAVRDGVVYFSDFSSLYAVDVDSGTLKWKIKAPGGVANALAVSKASVFYSTESRKFFAIDVSNGQIRWSIKTKAYSFEPIIVGNRVFVGGTEELLLLDAETGQKYPTVELGKNVAHTPTVLDNVAIVYNGDGFLFAVTK